MDNVKTALVKDIKLSLDKTLDDIIDIAQTHLNDDGLVCSDCQLVCIINAVNDLRKLVNGITVEDLKI